MKIEEIIKQIFESCELRIQAIEEQYNAKLEAKNEIINTYKEEIQYLRKIIITLSQKPIINNNSNQVKVQTMTASESQGNTFNQSGNFGIGQMSGGEIKEGAKVAGVFNEAEQKSLVETAAEIQQLLKQLEQSYPTETLSQKAIVAEQAIKQIEANPNWKQKIIDAIKAMGIEAFMELIDNPVANVLCAGIEAWLEGK
jgi:cysteinyl-tRNA synthetase